ncbi:MAG: peptide chain release factor-like protein [Candidatus Eisenbacteria bacterium]|uniref:Peptide chain release factor-like protein n=1 Tax=Eiseniibacteriota bacterium TaxID=2212470 RepID=A0A933SGY3_UNCEI|nr:peptide chain release factor-like protein [Candidatus Eisenbacteria bacterium]
MPLPEHLQRLLAECEVEAYRSSGPGGQKKNKTESSVRVRHVPTGVVRIATESRSQMRNREAALQRVYDTLEARKRKPKPRVATKPSRAAKERRIESKRRTSEVKRQRSRRVDPD